MDTRPNGRDEASPTLDTPRLRLRHARHGDAFVPSARGRGLAGEAVRRACRYGFERLGLARVVALTEPDNAPSRRLLARLGFVEVGTSERSVRHVLDAPSASDS